MVTHGDLPTVMADEVQLVQLFQNLIGNAKFRREGVTPEVHVGVELLPPPLVGEPALSRVEGGRGGGGEWLFSVRDNGIGIESKYFERIFQIFQ